MKKENENIILFATKVDKNLRDELQEIKQMLNIYIQRDNQWHSQV